MSSEIQAPQEEPINSASEEKYLEKELYVLRKEIDDSKDRTFKIITGQVFALPIVELLSKEVNSNNHYSYILLIMPFIVLILVLTYVHEQKTVLRAGLYIKENIEPRIGNKSGDVAGWENWLEKKRTGMENNKEKTIDLRDGDKYLRHGFWVLSAIYYIFSLSLALDVLREPMGNITLELLLGNVLIAQFNLFSVIAQFNTVSINIISLWILLVYAVTGIYVFGLAFRECPISTSTFC